MKRLILVACILIPILAKGQFENQNDFPSPNRTVHWVRGTAFTPIWVTRGTNQFAIHTDTISLLQIAPKNDAMNYKLLWIKANGDISAFFPSYLLPVDTLSLSNRIDAKLNAVDTMFLSNRIDSKVNIIDTTDKWAPKGIYITSETDPVWTAASSNYWTKIQSDSRYVQVTDTSNRWAPKGIYADKRIETFLGTTDGSGNYTVTYSPSYSVTPDVQPQLQAGTPSQVVRITSSTNTGFTVTVTNRASVTLLGIEVLLAATTPVSGASVGVLVTAR